MITICYSVKNECTKNSTGVEKETNKSLQPHLILEQPECKSGEQQSEH